MASVTAIRQALRDTIQNAIGTSIQGYDTVPGIANLPAFVVEPAKTDFAVAMGRGTDDWTFNVYVFASRADEALGQNTLDPFISGAGPKSIRQVIFNNSSLGLTDGTTAFVRGMKGYGGSSKEAFMPMVGAILVVCVYTNGAVE